MHVYALFVVQLSLSDNCSKNKSVSISKGTKTTAVSSVQKNDSVMLDIYVN